MAELVTIEVGSLSPFTHHELYVHSFSDKNTVSVEPKSADAKFAAQATWKLVPALIDQTDKNLVSIESVDQPGTYLRHANGILVRAARDATAVFPHDSSFFLRPGLFDAKGFSFESVNFPGSFINVDGSQLRLGPPTPAAATFFVASPLFPVASAFGTSNPRDYKTFENTSWAGSGLGSQSSLPTKEAAFAWFLPQRAADPTLTLLTWNPAGGGTAWKAQTGGVNLSPYPGYTTWQFS